MHVITNNSQGGFEIKTINAVQNIKNSFSISYCTFSYNTNGSLKLTLLSSSYFTTLVLLNNLLIIGNSGNFDQGPDISSDFIHQGTGIFLWFSSLNIYIEISFCNILNNIGGDSSIVYLESSLSNHNNQIISIRSSQFTSNLGSALYLSNCFVNFEGSSLFTSNSAPNGAAVYVAKNSLVAISENSTLKFVNNAASLYGGAIYVNLPITCVFQGITFIYLPNSSVVLFVNNSAEIAGDSLYFSIPESCNVTRNPSDSSSFVHIPYQFTYVYHYLVQLCLKYLLHLMQ